VIREFLNLTPYFANADKWAEKYEWKCKSFFSAYSICLSNKSNYVSVVNLIRVLWAMFRLYVCMYWLFSGLDPNLIGIALSKHKWKIIGWNFTQNVRCVTNMDFYEVKILNAKCRTSNRRHTYMIYLPYRHLFVPL
jgi:hypothetical protein